MKKILSVFLSVLMLLSVMPMSIFAEESTLTANTSWYNDTAEEFTINTAEELAGLSTLVNEGNNFSGKTVKLGNNIDLGNKNWTPIGGTNAFIGTFDGGNYTISNLYINSNDNNVGLFGNVWQGKEIKNVNIKNANVTGGNESVAVLVGKSAVKLTNCHISGEIYVKGGLKYIGGIAGYYYGTMDNCSIIGSANNVGKVIADNFAGILAGFIGENSTITNNTVKYMSLEATGGGFGFGIIAGNANYGLYASNNTIENCTVNSSDPYDVTGTLIGQIAGTDEVTQIYNNNIKDTTTTVKNETVTTMVGAGGDNGKAVVGSGVEFDEDGKVTSGVFEVVPPSEVLADGVQVPAADDNGNIVIPEVGDQAMVTVGGNNATLMSLVDAFAAAKATQGATITLLSDVTLTEWQAPAMDVVTFTLDGNNKTISGLTQPLFASAATGSVTVTVKNLIVADSDIAGVYSSHSGVNNAGAIFGVTGHNNVVIDNCHVVDSKIGDSSTYYAGGLIGYSAGGTTVINNCSVNGIEVTAESSTGGFIGHTNGGVEITGAELLGNIKVTSTDAEVRPDKAGSVIGRNNGGVDKLDVTDNSTSVVISPAGSVNSTRVIGSIVGGNIEITGGSYQSNPTLVEKTTVPTIADGFELKENNGKFTVGPADIKAEVSNETAAMNPKHDFGSVIFGEAIVTNGVAIKELVIKLYSNDTLLATTNVNNVDGFLDKNNVTTLSWHILIEGTVDSYWTTVWEGDGPVADFVPTHIVTYINGDNVGTTEVTNNHDGGVIITTWDKMPGVKSYVAAIGDVKYATLEDAIVAAGDGAVITVFNGTHVIPGNVTNKNITFKGEKTAVIKPANEGYEGGVTATGSTLAFDGVTVEFNNNNYRGFKHSNKITYTGCTLIGTQFLYAPEVAFTDCTFEMCDEKTEYSVWTYGAKNVTFTNCEFNTNGKAVLVYTEAATVADIKLNNCDFYNKTNVYTDKAAVEVGQSAYGNKATYTLEFTDCTADGFVENNSTSSLWGNKNGMDAANMSVTKDNEAVVTSVAMVGDFACATIEGAFAKATDDKTEDKKITLLCDVTLSKAIVLDKGDITLDLGEYTLTLAEAGVICLTGNTSLTVNGTGNIIQDSTSTIGYIFICTDNSALTLTENLGKIEAGLTVAQADDAAQININGGTLSAWSTYEDKSWVLNYVDSAIGTAKITVGGNAKFIDFDPAHAQTEPAVDGVQDFSFCAEGYTSKLENGVYSIVEEVKEPVIGNTTKMFVVKDYMSDNYFTWGGDNRYHMLITVGIDDYTKYTAYAGFDVTINGHTERLIIKEGMVWEKLVINGLEYNPSDYNNDSGVENTRIMYYVLSFDKAFADTNPAINIKAFVQEKGSTEITYIREGNTNLLPNS